MGSMKAVADAAKSPGFRITWTGILARPELRYRLGADLKESAVGIV
jgi:hypothetical protein